MQRELICILSSGQRPIPLQCTDLSCDGHKVFVTVILLRQSFSLADLWSRVARFVWLPLGTGIVTALAVRYLVDGEPLTLTPLWWYVVGSYALAAGVILVIVVTVSRIGPYDATCWRDMCVIASRLLPAKVL
jgi:hypothetical protein